MHISYIHAFREFLGRKFKGLFISSVFYNILGFRLLQVFPIYFVVRKPQKLSITELFDGTGFKQFFLTSIVSTYLWLSNKTQNKKLVKLNRNLTRPKTPQKVANWKGNGTPDLREI